MSSSPNAAQNNSAQTSTLQSSTARSSAIMAAGTMVSRVLGFVRTALLAVAIGSTSLAADVFEKANAIPNVIFMLLAGGVFNVVLVPQLIKAAKNPDRGADYTSRLLTLTTIVMGAFTLVVVALAAPLMSILTKDWSEPMLALGTSFALWTLPQIFFYGMYAVVGQVLNANGRFGAYMWAPVANNLIAIGVIGFYIITFGRFTAEQDQLQSWSTEQTWLLAGGHTLGIVVQALVLLLPLARLGLKLRPTFGWRGMGMRSTGKIAAWTLLTMTIGNVATLLYARLVSGATAARQEADAINPGSGAAIPGEYALNTAELITVLPHSVFVLSIATVLFNQLASSMGDGDHARAKAVTNQGLRTFSIPMVFGAGAIMVLAGPLGRIFGGSSDVAIASGAAIGQLLVILAIGMPFRSAHFYLLRVFYADENAKIPMLIQSNVAVCGVVLAYTLSLFVPNAMFAYVMACLYAMFHIIQLGITHVLVRKHYGSYGGLQVLDTYLRTAVATIIAAIFGVAVLWLLGGYDAGFAWSGIPQALIACAVVGTVMGAVYYLVLRRMKVPELDFFFGPLLNRLPWRKSNS